MPDQITANTFVKIMMPRTLVMFWTTFLVGSAGFLVIALKPSLLFSTGTVTQQNPREVWRHIPFSFDTLRPGDLIVRSSNNFFSDQLRRYNTKDNRYSHCALVTIGRSGTRYVYHSIGGSENPDQIIRCDSVYTFLNPEDVTGFAIYRYLLPPNQIAAIDSVATKYYREKRMFDMKFDLEDDERLYCAEFVYKAIINAVGNTEMLSLSRQREKVYVGVDDLYLNNQIQKLFEYAYD